MGCAQSTQEDPIGLAGGLNLYGYAGGDPVNYRDPFGLDECPIGTGGVWPNCFRSAAAMGLVLGSALGRVGRLLRTAVRGFDRGSGTDASTWHGQSGILRDAAKQRGNGGGATATSVEAEQLGQAWVGEGAVAIEGGKGLRSADKLRVYRRPEVKSDGKIQANLETMGPDGKGVVGNYHVEIVAPKKP